MDQFEAALSLVRNTPRKDLPAVAKATKIPWPTIIKYKYDLTKSPRLAHLKKLLAWAEKQNGSGQGKRKNGHPKAV